MSSDVADDLFSTLNDVLSSKMEPTAAFDKIMQLKESCPDVPSILLDVLVGVEGETLGEQGAAAKEKLVAFVDLINDTLIPRDVLAMELDCLEANLPSNRQQLVRLKTRLYFKQSKFNLLREESEGYAKLITELLDSEGGEVSAKSLMTRLLCLIGQFNLDPNRVTDIVLECFECCPQRKSLFVNLLTAIKANREYLCTLLGFKFTFYQKEGRSTPFSLYILTASLLSADLVDFMKITSFMEPRAEGIKESHKARASNAATRAKKAETIMTSQIPLEPNRLNMDSHSGDVPQVIVGVSFAVVTAIQEEDDRKIMGELTEKTVLGTNQKLGLVCALVEEGAWTLAKQIIDRLPEYYAVQASPRVCKAIADLVDDSIDAFYHEKCSRQLEGVASPKKKSTKADDSRLKPVTSWSELSGMSSILWYLGPRIAYRPLTATKLIRLIALFYKERAADPAGSDEHVANVLMDVVDECLLPGMSLLSSSPNAALSEELWGLLHLFPYTWRYRLYGRWKTMHSIRHPELNVSRGKVLGRTKYVLKRLSKETVKVMGRQLGKLCHIHPITVFDYLLSQVQTFDSLIQPVVESLKFLTSLEFDILSYCIMDQLASPDKQQLKASDGTLSPWLQALATLVGAIYKKYNVELAGILNYVANQLKNEKSFDLLILREIIQNMSSVESTVGATQDQLEALQGGEVLRHEAGGFSNVRNKRASARLKDALLDGDMATGLCILIAQQRECVVHNDSSQLPLKLVGEMVDQCRDTLMQFCSFLLSNVKTDEYARRMPPAPVLIGEYNVPLDSAMYLARATYMPKVIAAYDGSKKARKLLEGEGKQKLDSKQKFLFFKSAMDETVDQLIEDLKPCIPDHVNCDIPLRLLVVFWMLSLYDIEVPTGAYEKAIESTKKQAREVAENPEISKSRRSREEDRLKGVENRLREEQKRQTEHVERVRMWLCQGKDALFESSRNMQTAGFLQMCIMPRVLFSELDAIYCARLVILLHQQRTTFFQTLIFIDKTFLDLLPLCSGLSENEASSFGSFLEMILSHVMRWHGDKAIFEKECTGFPGFITKVQHQGSTQDGRITYDSFRSLCYKFQARTSRAFLSVLKKENNDYVLLRNCLIIMTKMVSCFPVIKDLHGSIEEAVGKVRDWEKGRRDDLSLKAASYAGRLRMSSTKLWERQLFSPNARPVGKAAAKTAGGTPTGGKDRKRVAAGTAPPKKTKSAKVEKKENEQREKVVKQEAAEKEAEDGEVPPSPPPKKLRVPPLSEAASTNGKEKNGRDRRSRDAEKETVVKEERGRRTEKEPEDDFAGPAPPPALVKKEREGSKKEDDKRNLKRTNRDPDNGDLKIPRKEKERETMESRISRPPANNPKSRSATPKLEKEKEKKERRQARESKASRR